MDEYKLTKELQELKKLYYIQRKQYGHSSWVGREIHVQEGREGRKEAWKENGKGGD
jgi:hypothetical protein